MACAHLRRLTPWVVRHLNHGGLFSSTPIAIDAEAYERAARVLDALRARVEAGEIRIEPYGEEEHLSRNVVLWGDLIRAARANPVAHLARGAETLRLHALLMRLSTGQPIDAKFLEDLEGEERALYAVCVSSAALYRGDVDTAMKSLAPVEGVADPTLAVIVALHQAMIAMHEHDPEAAHAASARALDLVGKTEGSVSQLLGPASHWLRLATAIAVGRPAEAPAIAFPEIFEREGTTWNALLASDAATRRAAPFHMLSMDIDVGMRAVFPAVLYVLHAVSDDGVDPDVWTDNLLALHSASLYGATAMRARAEAAHWRRDTAAASRWTARATALETFFVTPQGSILARLAGLDG